MDSQTIASRSRMLSLHTKMSHTGLFGAEDTPTVLSATLARGWPIAVPDTRGVAMIVPMAGISGDESMAFYGLKPCSLSERVRDRLCELSKYRSLRSFGASELGGLHLLSHVSTNVICGSGNRAAIDEKW